VATFASSVPTVIAGRYQIGEPLGRGGMAEVRAGTDLRLDRPVAVKFLLPEMAARDDIRRRFEAEARAAAQLSDPHAVAVYDTGEHDGLPYIVMERLPGNTLAERIAAGPVDPAWLRTIARQVLGALAAAHAAGLVHRDVKPGNILLTADGNAKIADFGIAKSLDTATDGVDLTGTGQLLGTPAYLPPERLDGAPATARSDLYSLGVVLYEALAGFRPFDGDTPLSAARAVAAGVHRPLTEVRPGIDAGLAAAIERAMATDPSRRFASAPEMAAALTGAPAGDTPTLADAASELTATSVLEVPPAEPAGAAGDAGAPGAVRPGAPPRLGVRVALAVLVVLVVAAILLAGRSRTRQPAASRATAPASSAPATTPSSTVTTQTARSPVAQSLLALADRIGPTDGVRAGDLASRLRQLADQVDAGGAGPTATNLIVSVAAWHSAGQLSDSATVAALQALSAVPGTAGTATAPAAQTPTPTVPRATAPAAANDNGKGKGKGGKD
jgi:serine/threonine-protein kinase